MSSRRNTLPGLFTNMEDERSRRLSYEAHQSKLIKALPTIDDKPPSVMKYRRSSKVGKTLQLFNDRDYSIKVDNAALLRVLELKMDTALAHDFHINRDYVRNTGSRALLMEIERLNVMHNNLAVLRQVMAPYKCRLEPEWKEHYRTYGNLVQQISTWKAEWYNHKLLGTAPKMVAPCVDHVIASWGGFDDSIPRKPNISLGSSAFARLRNLQTLEQAIEKKNSFDYHCPYKHVRDRHIATLLEKNARGGGTTCTGIAVFS